MKWRLALALAVALALPVPLLWLARLAVRPEPPSESGLAPMLGKAERWKHPSEGVRVSAECVRARAPGQPPCPAGFRCLAEVCRRTCEVQAPSGCQQGKECIHWVDLGTGLCRPR